jgi:predicted dehydrogenase
MNVAVLGLGFMGTTHAQAWRGVPGARLAAVMSSDERKLSGDLSSISGNLGNSGEVMDFSAVAKYRTIDAVLADPGIDAVDICLPTDSHAPVAIAALRAGKHVLVEKPIALDRASAEEVILEAEAAGRILMAGQVLRFIPAYSKLSERLPAVGPVRFALFRRRCAAPAWSKWLSDASRSGGGVFDLLIHDVDYCVSQWGLPESVQATGYSEPAVGIDLIHAELAYPGMGPVVVTGGWHHPKSYPFSMEFTVTAAQATFEWPFGAPELKEFGVDGEATVHELPKADAFALELDYFARCVLENRQPEFCPPRQSAQAVGLMRLILQARETGEKIKCAI